MRYVYFGETDSGRLLAAALVERGKRYEWSPRTTWMPG